MRVGARLRGTGTVYSSRAFGVMPPVRTCPSLTSAILFRKLSHQYFAQPGSSARTSHRLYARALAIPAVGFSYILPWLLLWVVRRLGVRREIEPVIPITLTLAIAGAIVVLAFNLATSLGAVRKAITGNALPVGCGFSPS
jgi:hypothetical protein